MQKILHLIGVQDSVAVLTKIGTFRQIGKGWGISGAKDCGNNAVVPRVMKFFQNQLNRFPRPSSQMAKIINGSI